MIARNTWLVALIAIVSAASFAACNICVDEDGDGYGLGPQIRACENTEQVDCVDDPSDDPIGCDTCTCGDAGCLECARCINPGMQEGPSGDQTCEDGVDNDCDGLIDIADNVCAQCSSPVDCDDGNPCTDDSCEGFLCVYTDNNASCDDGDPCTSNDACSQGVCGGEPLDADGDTYVRDSCDGTDCDDDPSDDPEGCDTCTCGDAGCFECAKCINPGMQEGPRSEPMCRDCVDNDCDGFPDGVDSGCAEEAAYDGTFDLTYVLIWHNCYPMPVLYDSTEITVQDETILFFVDDDCITASGTWSQANSQGSDMVSPWSCVTPEPSPGCEPCQKVEINITFTGTDSFLGSFLVDALFDADCGQSMCVAEYTITGTRSSP